MRLPFRHTGKPIFTGIFLKSRNVRLTLCHFNGETQTKPTHSKSTTNINAQSSFSLVYVRKSLRWAQAAVLATARASPAPEGVARGTNKLLTAGLHLHRTAAVPFVTRKVPPRPSKICAWSRKSSPSFEDAKPATPCTFANNTGSDFHRACLSAAAEDGRTPGAATCLDYSIAFTFPDSLRPGTAALRGQQRL